MENLTAEESAQYMKVVQKGNMDTMFDFAYTLGWKKAMQYMEEEVKKFSEGFGYKK